MRFVLLPLPLLLLLWATGGLAAAARLVEQQIESYRSILGTDKLTFDGFKTLISMHDDWTCTGTCENYIKPLFGVDGIDWLTLVNRIADKLYPGQISDDPNLPQEVHLALTGRVDEMKVMWVTGINMDEPYVEYKLASDDWSRSSKQPALNSTYRVPQYSWPIFEGVIYEADMTGLLPRTSYKYRVCGADAEAEQHCSSVFDFKSPPSTQDPDQRVSMALLGDQGTFMFLGFATTDLLVSLQDEQDVDLVMTAGDLAYAGFSSFPGHNVTSDDEFEHIWDLWGIQNEPVAATRPFMVGVGNHEKFYNYTSFNARYKMPSASSGGRENFWYSYDYGNVHWVSVSSEHSLDEGSEQMSWLQADLAAAAANRRNVPWIAMSLHRPIYCSSFNSFDDTRPGSKYQVALEPLLLQYDVDLTLTGHMHCYERVHPNVNGSVSVLPQNDTAAAPGVDVYAATGRGPVHVVQGNTGAMQDTLWMKPTPKWSAIRFANGFIPSDVPLIHPRRDDDGSSSGEEVNVQADELEGLILSSNYTDTYGLGIATFANSTHLHYRALAITGTIGTDEFWIIKNRDFK